MQAKLVHFNELGKTLEDSQAFFFFGQVDHLLLQFNLLENMPEVNRCTINLANQKVP